MTSKRESGSGFSGEVESGQGRPGRKGRLESPGLFGYGDSALLIFLFSLLSMLVWGGGGLTGWKLDHAVFMLGIPLLSVCLYLGYKGRKQPAGFATLLLAGYFAGIFLLLLIFRLFHLSL